MHFSSRVFGSRRAQAEMISWILIVGFVIGLGTFMFFWLTERTNSSISMMNTYSADTADCEYVSIHISSSCQDMQKIYLNITNTNSLPVDSLIFRSYDLSANPLVLERNLTIRPRVTKEVIIFKEAITKKLEIIPLTEVSGKKVVCKKKMVTLDSIDQCPWTNAQIT